MSKEILVLLGFLFLIILSLSNVSAQDWCWVELNSADCVNNNGKVGMSLSDATNAHGALAGQGGFAPVLCCNFGDEATSCTSDNKILGLSSSTNAHAEIPDLVSPNYNIDVCYDGLKDCRETTDSCSTAMNEIEVVYLSSGAAQLYTNAHIEGAGLSPQNYNSKICCGIDYAALCDLTTAEWQYEEVMKEGNVGAIVNGTYCSEIEISFEVFRGTTSCDSIDGCTNPPNVFFGSGITSVSGTWNAGPIHDNEYHFVVTVVNNPGETVQSSIPDLLVKELPPEYCSSITICSQYESEAYCNPDSCEVADESVPTDIDCSDPDINCECIWEDNECKASWGGGKKCGNNVIDLGEPCDGSLLDGYSCTDFDEFTGGNLLCNSQCTGFITSSCTGYSCNNDGTRDVGEACDGNNLGGFSCTDFDEFTGGDLLCNSACDFDTGQCIGGGIGDSEIGTCIYTQFTDDTCDDDGFLTFSWTAEFMWAEGMGPGDDVKGFHLNCVDGQKTVECPAQIPLPFFNIYSFVAALIIIALIYVILILRKEKRKR